MSTGREAWILCPESNAMIPRIYRGASVSRGIREYTLRFRRDIKELADEFGGSYQQEFRRSVEQLRNRFEKDIEKMRKRIYSKVM